MAHRSQQRRGQTSFSAPHKLGRTADAAHRLLLRFNIPRLPTGSNITKATLLVKPGDYVNLNSIDVDGLLAAVKAYPIKTGTGPWRGNNDPSKATPEFDEAAAFAPSVQMMGYMPRSSQSGVQWDVTSAVNGWRTPNVDGGLAVNHGVILKADVEACTPRGYFLPFLTCGAFLFDSALNNWPQSELEFTQQGSRDPLDVEKTETGGVRLIVQYTAAALNEGQPVTMNYLGANNVPPGVDPYYKVTHPYVLPAAPNYWQAIAVRGFGPSEGQNPPPVEGQVFR